MYEDFYGLKKRPFLPVPTPDCYVPITPAQEALDTVLNCVGQGQGIAILTGDAGAGKTAFCRQLETALGGQFRPVYLGTSAFHTRRALLQAALCELGIDYIGLTEQEARLKLMETAREHAARKSPLVLILDEAHLLSMRLLEELRTVSDQSADGTPLIRLVLAGQFALEEKLTDPGLSAFGQRIGVHVYLEPLSLQHSADYITARLSWAGAKEPERIFTDEALLAMCRASDGNPRCLNQLADHSLLLGYAAASRPIPVETIRTALEDLKELPLQWNAMLDDGAQALGNLSQVKESGPPTDMERDVEFGQVPPIFGNEDNHLLDTDEFEIPDLLQSVDSMPERPDVDDSSEAAEPEPHPVLAVVRSGEPEDVTEDLDTCDPHRQEPPRSEEVGENEFAVIEVGARYDAQVDSDETETGNWEVSVDRPAVPSAPGEFSESARLIGDEPDSEELIEIDVKDHYALIDRRDELPAARRGEVTIGPAPRTGYVDHSAEFDDCDEHLVTTSIELMPAGWSESAGQELDVLESVHALRAQVGGTPATSDLGPPESEDDLDWLDFDVVQPSFEEQPIRTDATCEIPTSELTGSPDLDEASGRSTSGDSADEEKSGVAEDNSVSPSAAERAAGAELAGPTEETAVSGARRYAQLFTRLRWRRERIKNEQGR